MRSGRVDIHKMPGMSSHDVIYKVRRALNVKKAGHSGTLDPMAEGVLSVFIGQATKFIDLLRNSYKKYDVWFEYGKSSDTFDIMGIVTDTNLPFIDRQQFEQVAASFLGEQSQMPPMYSAVSVQGKRLYQYAREGLEVERSPRPIDISELKVIEWDGRCGRIQMTCSTGTYVRSVVHDMAAALGTDGIMTKLIRTENDFVPLSACVTLDQLSAADIHRPDRFHPGPRVAITLDLYRKLRQGLPVTIPSQEQSPRILLEVAGEFAGTAKQSPQGYIREKIYHDISSSQ